MDERSCEPTAEEWRRLYAAADEFKKTAPWQWMRDNDLFGVQDPESGEVGYCCVMGNLGEHYALGVYLGSQGLMSYFFMAEHGNQIDPIIALATQKALMASWEDRNTLSDRERQQIKDLGLTYRGRQSWPQFLSYRPGYEPWRLERWETLLLTTCLQQAQGVALRVRDDPRLISPPLPTQFLVRVPYGEGDGLVWRDEWLEPEPYLETELRPAMVDSERVDEVAATPRSHTNLELGFEIMPVSVRESDGGRPYFPIMVLAAETRGGMLLAQDLSSREDLPQKLVNVLLSAVALGGLPDSVRVASEAAMDVLEPLAQRLKVKLQLVDQIPAVDEAFDFMIGRFTG